MSIPTLFTSDLKAGPQDHCPLCGSGQFSLQTAGADARFVSQTCSMCGLSCFVVLGPESPTVEARLSEWAAVFVHD